MNKYFITHFRFAQNASFRLKSWFTWLKEHEISMNWVVSKLHNFVYSPSLANIKSHVYATLASRNWRGATAATCSLWEGEGIHHTTNNLHQSRIFSCEGVLNVSEFRPSVKWRRVFNSRLATLITWVREEERYEMVLLAHLLQGVPQVNNDYNSRMAGNPFWRDIFVFP